MIDRTKKFLLFASIGVLSLGAIGTTIGFSMAGFADTKSVDRLIGLSGENDVQKKSIFLNANIWGSTGDPTYYIDAWKNGDNDSHEWVTFSRIVTPTINAVDFTMYVFVFDTTKFDRIVFYRMNPNHASLPSYESAWNHTCDINFNSGVNYYCIENWDSASYGNSGYSTNTLSLNQYDNLYFSGSNSGVINT